jgi:hypothetical protein
MLFFVHLLSQPHFRATRHRVPRCIGPFYCGGSRHISSEQNKHLTHSTVAPVRETIFGL